MSRSAANALLLLAGAIWGMGFVAQAAAMDSIGPFLFVGRCCSPGVDSRAGALAPEPSALHARAARQSSTIL